MIRRIVNTVVCLGLLLLPPHSSQAQPEQTSRELPGLHVLRSDEQGVRLELAVPDYQITWETRGGEDYHSLQVPGAQLSAAPGEPELPYFSALIGVPSGVAVELRLLENDMVRLAGQFKLPNAPHPAALEEDFQPGRLVYKAGEPDGQSSSTPEELSPGVAARLGEPAWLRDQRVVRVEVYPFQYDRSQQVLLWHRNLQIELIFSGRGVGGSSLEPPSSASAAEAHFEAVLQSAVLNYASARAWRGIPQFPSPLLPASNLQSLGPRYKIVIDHDGLYRLTYAALKTAGLPVDSLDPSTFTMSSQGRAVTIYVHDSDANPAKFSAGEYIDFYGQKFRGDILAARYAFEDDDWPAFGSWQPRLNAAMFEKYTDENVYWLLFGGVPGLRMVDVNGTPQASTPVPSHFYDTVRAEESHEWWTWHFTGEDTWFWEYAQVSGSTPVVTHTYTVNLEGVAAVDLPATVRGEVVARQNSPVINPDHSTAFYLNNRSTPVEKKTWDGLVRHVFSGQVAQADLREGANTLRFVVEKIPNLASDRIAFDWFEIEYARQFRATADQLIFGRPEWGTLSKYQVTNFASNSVFVYDITDPFSPRRITGQVVTPVSGGYRVDFEGSHPGEGSYIVAGAGGLQSPKSISYYNPPDLFSPSNAADYLIITHAAFSDAVQALANFRAAQGLRTRVVDVADLYNEFNDGIYHPLAIKNFLAYTFAHWQPPAPSYVLLVGNGHWNFKGYTGPANYWSVPIYMPPHLVWVDPWQGEVDSANRLANIVGTDILPDLAIGRLPVDTLDQLNAAISKTIAYEQAGWNPAQKSWQKRLLFIADNVPDPAGDFVMFSNSIISETIPLHYDVDRVYLNHLGCPPGGAGSCPAATTAIVAVLNNTGALFVNYIGHGADERWAHEAIFKTTAVTGDQDDPAKNNILLLSNSDRLPVVLSMTCLDGYWIHTLPNKISLAVELVRAPDRGAVATFSPTGLGVASGHDVLNRGFFNAVFRAGTPKLGLASIAAKLALYGTGYHFDLIDTFTIFGDPALRMQVTYHQYLPLLGKE